MAVENCFSITDLLLFVMSPFLIFILSAFHGTTDVPEGILGGSNSCCASGTAVPEASAPDDEIPCRSDSNIIAERSLVFTADYFLPLLPQFSPLSFH
ncbi:MAG: hypothetical protein Q4F43_04735, partial [Eubacteriales bacterium]|nr:hypothetical protein [Eubacteriales bacterium]